MNPTKVARAKFGTLSADYVRACEEYFRLRHRKLSAVIPPFALARWVDVAEQLVGGYFGDEFSLMNDVNCRTTLERALTAPGLRGFPETEELRARVDRVDRVVRTVWLDGVLPGGAGWWDSGTPRHGSKFLAESLRTRGLSITTVPRFRRATRPLRRTRLEGKIVLRGQVKAASGRPPSAETDPLRSFLHELGEDVDTAPGLLLRRWKAFVDECERGYRWGGTAYRTDVLTRLTIDQLVQEPRLRNYQGVAELAREVGSVDDRLRPLLGEHGLKDFCALPWWGRFVCSAAGPQTVADWSFEGLSTRVIYAPMEWDLPDEFEPLPSD